MALDFSNTNSPMNFESGGLLGSYSKNYNDNKSSNPTIIENMPTITFNGANGATQSGYLPSADVPTTNLLGVNNPIMPSATETPTEEATASTTTDNKTLYYIIGAVILFMVFKKGE